MKMKPRFLSLLAMWLWPIALCPGATITVEIRNFYFTPTNIVIQPGDTVVWRNTAFTPHDSTHRAPVGSRLWTSPLLAQNETFSRTFTQAGVFPYMCALHIGNFPQQTGTVSVVAANLAPTVQISSPSSGTSFAAPAEFTITASADDGDGSVANVQFFANGNLLGASQGPQFTFAVSSLAPGAYALTAVATDNQGATGTSTPVNITVQEAPVNHALSLSSSPANGGAASASPPQPAQGYPSGTTVSVTAAPAEGFTFSGWTGAASGTQNPLTVLMDSPKAVTANFSPIVLPSFLLAHSVDPVNGGSIEVNPAPNAAGGKYVQGTVVTLTAVPAAGYSFSNWIGAASGSNSSVAVTIDAEKAVTAQFAVVAPPVHQVAFAVSPADGGTIAVTPSSSNGMYMAGTQLAVSAQPAPGFRFVRWTGSVNSTNNPIPLLVDGDKTLTADFERMAGLDFDAIRGAFAGLLMDETGTNYSASGSVTLRVSRSGAFRGNAIIGGMRAPIRGQFDRLGYAPFATRAGSLIGSLQIEPVRKEISGFLSDGAQISTVLLAAVQPSTNGIFTGSYSMSLPAREPVADQGAAQIEVRSDGVVRIRGRLGDGATILQRTFVTAGGTVPLFVPLYHRRGSLLGWLNLAEGNATVSWFRPGDSRSLEYPQGFALHLPVEITPAAQDSAPQ